MPSKRHKGQDYERELCRQFSLWLSDGKHDDWLWRSSQSGGRATTRAKKGKKTTGHCGDLTASCKKAEVFTKKFAVESKRGYSALTPLDLIDREGKPVGANTDSFYKFVVQSANAAALNGCAKGWMLVHRRNGRPPMVYMNAAVFRRLVSEAEESNMAFCEFRFRQANRFRRIVGCVLGEFFAHADPKELKRV